MVLALALFALLPTVAIAQEGTLVDRCRAETAMAGDEALRACNLVAQAVASVQSPLGVAASGGNPVPGTASTLGMRMGSLPRVSVAGRFSASRARIPEIRDLGARGDKGFFLPGLHVDASVGLSQGFSPLPTVGGMASLDVLGSAGVILLPSGAGWDDGSVFSWALGARLGILRESFTLPGVSASLMYRRVGSARFGDRSLNAEDAFFDVDVANWSLRGTVGKRILGVSLTGGLGYDWYSSDARWGVLNPEATGPSELRASYGDFDTSRTLAFANVAYTFLVLHLVGELGWQTGPEMVPGLLPDTDYRTSGGTLFGGLSVRLSI